MSRGIFEGGLKKENAPLSIRQIKGASSSLKNQKGG